MTNPTPTEKDVAEIAVSFIESEADDLYDIAQDYGAAIKSGKMGGRSIKPEQARFFAAEFRVRADALYIIAPQLRAHLIPTPNMPKGERDDG